jgi:hypothetical protein
MSCGWVTGRLGRARRCKSFSPDRISAIDPKIAAALNELTDLIAARCPGATFGFSGEDVWDIAEVAAMRNFTDRLTVAMGRLSDREYNGMAR